MNVYALPMSLKTQFAIFCDDVEKTFENFWVNFWATLGVLTVWTLFILLWIADQRLPMLPDLSPNIDISVFWVVVALLGIILAVRVFTGELEWDVFLLGIWFVIGCLISFGDPANNNSVASLLRDYWGITVVMASVYWFFQNWYTLHFVFNGDRLIKQYWGLFLVQILMYSVLYGIHFVIGVPAVFLGPRRFFRQWLIGKHDGDKAQRGVIVLSDIQANRPYREMLRISPGPNLLFGNLRIPLDEATKHFLIAGGSGSGKTITLRLLVQDIVKVLNSGIGRMIIYDATRETLPLLHGMRLTTPVYILNPFDQRCVAWHISRDCTAPADAESLAYTLILEPMANDKSDGFWKNSAWLLFKGVIEFYILNAPYQWTLRDVVLAFHSETTLAALLQSDERTAHYLDEALKNTDKTLSGIVQTIRAQTGQLQLLASLWDKATTRVSLKEWLSQNAVLVLGRDERAKVTLAAVNNLMLSQFTQLLMNQPSRAAGGTAEYFVVIDELGNFRMNCLEQLATEGRGRSVCLVAAVQDVLQLRKAYGANEAEIIAGQFTHKALLRFTMPEAQEWASRVIGEVEVRRTTASWDWHSALFGLIGWGSKTGMSENIQTIRAVLPSQFSVDVPMISAKTKTGLTGFYQARYIHKHTYPIKTLQNLLVPPDENCPGSIPAPDEWQWLNPWTEEDWRRLNIYPVMVQLEQQKLLQKFQQKYQPPVPSAASTTEEEEEWERSLSAYQPPDEEEETPLGTSNGQSNGGFTPSPANPTPLRPRNRSNRATPRSRSNPKIRQPKQRQEQQRDPHER